MYKVYAFDLGNVIIPFDHSTIANRLIDYSEKQEEFTIQHIHNFLYQTAEIEHLYEEGKITTDEFIKAICDKFSLTITKDRFKEIFCDIFFDAHYETVEIIKRLKEQKFKLILISNTNEMHFEYIKRRYEVINYFDEFLLSYKVGVRKPDKKIFYELINLSNCAPYEIFYTDDIEEYVKSASELNISTYHFISPEDLYNHINAILKNLNRS